MTQTEQLAQELYEADATRNQEIVGFPIEHWDEADQATKDRWMHLARVALAARLARA